MANIIAEHERRLLSRKNSAILEIKRLVQKHGFDFAGDDQSQCPVPSPKSLAEGKRRKQYLDAILANNTSLQPLALVTVIKNAAAEINDPKPPSSATVWRWRNMVEDGGDDLQTLSPAYNLRGKGTRLKPEVHQICIDSIAVAIWEKTLSYRKLHKKIVAQIEEKNKGRHAKNRLPTPSNETIRRMLKASRDALAR